MDSKGRRIAPEPGTHISQDNGVSGTSVPAAASVKSLNKEEAHLLILQHLPEKRWLVYDEEGPFSLRFCDVTFRVAFHREESIDWFLSYRWEVRKDEEWGDINYNFLSFVKNKGRVWVDIVAHLNCQEAKLQVIGSMSRLYDRSNVILSYYDLADANAMILQATRGWMWQEQIHKPASGHGIGALVHSYIRDPAGTMEANGVKDHDVGIVRLAINWQDLIRNFPLPLISATRGARVFMSSLFMDTGHDWQRVLNLVSQLCYESGRGNLPFWLDANLIPFDLVLSMFLLDMTFLIGYLALVCSFPLLVLWTAVSLYKHKKWIDFADLRQQHREANRDKEELELRVRCRLTSLYVWTPNFKMRKVETGEEGGILCSVIAILLLVILAGPLNFVPLIECHALLFLSLAWWPRIFYEACSRYEYFQRKACAARIIFAVEEARRVGERFERVRDDRWCQFETSDKLEILNSCLKNTVNENFTNRNDRIRATFGWLSEGTEMHGPTLRDWLAEHGEGEWLARSRPSVLTCLFKRRDAFGSQQYRLSLCPRIFRDSRHCIRNRSEEDGCRNPNCIWDDEEPEILMSTKDKKQIFFKYTDSNWIVDFKESKLVKTSRPVLPAEECHRMKVVSTVRRDQRVSVKFTYSVDRVKVIRLACEKGLSLRGLSPVIS